MDVTLSGAKPDLAQDAGVEEALSKLARTAARESPERRRPLSASDFIAAKPVPTVDPTLRATGAPVSGARKPRYGRTARTLSGLLLIAGLGTAVTLGWLATSPPQSGESPALSAVADAQNGPVTAEQTSQAAGPATSEKSAPPAAAATAEPESQPAGRANVEEAKPQPAPAARTAPVTTASAATAAASPAAASPPSPSPMASEQLQAMAQDVASLRQRVEQLTAGQEQMARTIARLQAAERDTRRRRPESSVVMPPASKPLATLPPPPHTQPLPPAAAAAGEPPPPRPPGAIR